MSASVHPQKQILVVGVDKGLVERIEPLLNRAYFSVERMPHGRSALELCGHVGFDLILVGHPLPDLETKVFVEWLRNPGSRAAGSQLVLLAEDAHLPEIANLVRKGGPGIALPLSEPRRILEEVATRLLGVAPRTNSRFLVQLEVELEVGKRLVMCQTENVSKGGFLIRTDQRYPIGTRIAFKSTLPGDRTPVEGFAEVMRHTVPDVEKLQGVGLRFVDLRSSDQKRLFEFLDRQPPAAHANA